MSRTGPVFFHAAPKWVSHILAVTGVFSQGENLAAYLRVVMQQRRPVAGRHGKYQRRVFEAFPAYI